MLIKKREDAIFRLRKGVISYGEEIPKQIEDIKKARDRRIADTLEFFKDDEKDERLEAFKRSCVEHHYKEFDGAVRRIRRIMGNYEDSLEYARLSQEIKEIERMIVAAQLEELKLAR